MSQNEVKPAGAANAGILLYAVGISVGGVVLIVANYLNNWSFGAYVLGGILAVAGVSMLIGRLRGGLTYVSIRCPRCQHEQTYAEEALANGRVVPCKSCFEYMDRDANGIRAVPEDRVAETPCFEAPFPPGGLSWEPACALCGAQATENEAVQGSNVQVGVVANQRITRTIEVPVCAAHRGQQAVRLGAGVYLDGVEGFAVSFRSYAERQRFRRLNPTEAKVSAASVTFGRQ